MTRVHFASDELHDFGSADADGHVKLFVPDGAGELTARDHTPCQRRLHLDDAEAAAAQAVEAHVAHVAHVKFGD